MWEEKTVAGRSAACELALKSRTARQHFGVLLNQSPRMGQIGVPMTREWCSGYERPSALVLCPNRANRGLYIERYISEEPTY
jgi:hypothetical protein